MLTDRQMTIVTGFAFLLVILVWQLASTSANVDGSVAVDCDAATPNVQQSCSYPSSAVFDVQVHVTSAPVDGYFAYQLKLRWDEARVHYSPTETALQENLWPACVWAGHVDNRTAQPPDSSLLSACVPFPLLTQGDTTTGAIVQFRFQCQQDGTSALALVPRDGDAQMGTHLLDARLSQLDPSLEGASVVCGQTATPPPTLPPARTSTPTATPLAPAPFEVTPPATPTVAPTNTPAPVATPSAAASHDVAIVDRNRRQPGIQISGWTGALRAPLGSAAGGSKSVGVTVENRGDHRDSALVRLSVLGLPEGCWVDGDGDGLPDDYAGETEISVASGNKAALTFSVTIECHAPRLVGETFRVELLAEIEHVGGGEAAGALASNTGSATGQVRVVSP